MVLGPPDHGGDLPGRIALGVDVHLLLHQGDDPLGVAVVVDRERGGQAGVIVLAAQEPDARAVEREDPHPLGDAAAQQPLDAIGHLPRGLVRERDRQDRVGADPFSRMR